MNRSETGPKDIGSPEGFVYYKRTHFRLIGRIVVTNINNHRQKITRYYLCVCRLIINFVLRTVQTLSREYGSLRTLYNLVWFFVLKTHSRQQDKLGV